MARVLLLMTRPLAGAGGRGMVLQTIIDSITGAGHEVVCAVVGGPADPAAIPGVRAVHRLPDVRLHEVLLGARARRRGLRSFNERLYSSDRVTRAVRAIARREHVDAVVADGVRLAAYAEDTGLPWFVDLDDLLSARYELWQDHDLDLHQLLGHRRPTNRLLAALLRRVRVRRLLAVEARRLRDREVEIARRADGVSLVSPTEAATLAERAGVEVLALPMAVAADRVRVWPAPRSPGTPESVGGPAPDRRLAFPGSLTAFANEEAVTWWVTELEPALRRRGLGGWQLHVYGVVPPEARERVEAQDRTGSVVLRGAFSREDLHAELVGHSFLLAPQREALGLTVKVVEAAVLGLVPVTTPQGASGMGVEHGRELLLFSDGDELADVLTTVERWTAHEPAEIADLAGRARAWATADYSPATLQRRWADVVARLTRPGRPTRPTCPTRPTRLTRPTPVDDGGSDRLDLIR
ncbi:glycosyltransferase [Kineococcus gynurae]|uniref:Glycosyltransferase n=1 Tax=Kineococcus gynurae TaxID=452979 RepID=A0ABV5LQN4_9ACTN